MKKTRKNLLLLPVIAILELFLEFFHLRFDVFQQGGLVLLNRSPYPRTKKERVVPLKTDKTLVGVPRGPQFVTEFCLESRGNCNAYASASSGERSPWFPRDTTLVCSTTDASVGNSAGTPSEKAMVCHLTTDRELNKGGEGNLGNERGEEDNLETQAVTN